ncbi:SDR family NAD(P)-dependent oxidoreductase [Adhaeribacter radiodurans]|uniref:SDR family NAD(P)-dependent oxidoreductase n=1 Tax=Adhaeribacter radiodurans TaxID=2745197 RepID=A0A7L7LAE0_9BACT|nr:hypothetical protein [Adhaeribacter radiodurans]QMU29713.1 hypothetical protein HUW48_17520 [Adhaeribacter radiodurans]
MQKPIGLGFTAKSNTAEIIVGINLTGKVAIITGGYTCIGLETTQTLAAASTVIMPVRSIQKAQQNLAGIANVELAEMDSMDHTSIMSVIGFLRCFNKQG